ncbi:MAG: preprotein translocase subunit YajC [Polyangiales bacterium]
MQALTEFLMQPDATNGTSAPGAPAPSNAPEQGGGGGSAGQFQMFLLLPMFLLFYFLMIRPQQKRQRETDTMLKALKRGDLVRTTGGIRGEITDITDADVVLLIADKVKINVLRSHIASKVAPESAAASAASKEKP